MSPKTEVGIPLSDADRTGHLPKLYFDLISRLRVAKNVLPPISVAASAHGQMRRSQGYSAGMLIEESRVLQVIKRDEIRAASCK
jgi:hypothetical protein